MNYHPNLHVQWVQPMQTQSHHATSHARWCGGPPLMPVEGIEIQHFNLSNLVYSIQCIVYSAQFSEKWRRKEKKETSEDRVSISFGSSLWLLSFVRLSYLVSPIYLENQFYDTLHLGVVILVDFDFLLYNFSLILLTHRLLFHFLLTMISNKVIIHDKLRELIQEESKSSKNNKV